ncbi:MAG: hypothetical protein M0R22_08155, partial [Dehalococcoidia bacterium]|nr:hypothetical protein [Dehalococcoidia bacterium]
YADQPRIKAGRKLSAIAAVWVGTAGTTVTMKLVTSQPTEVAATATAQAWTIIKCENLALDGTYVDLQFTTDTADTFYVVPLGVCIGEKAVPLGPRPTRWVDKGTVYIVNNTDVNWTWTDVDCTASTSPLAMRVYLMYMFQHDSGGVTTPAVRRNGLTGDPVSYQEVGRIAQNSLHGHPVTVLLDDANIFEYIGSTDILVEKNYISIVTYEEWG